MAGYISVQDAASRANLSEQYIRRMIAQERIEGALRISGVWIIPEDFTIRPAERPRGRPKQSEET